MIDYPAILRAAGLQVIEYPRWRQRTSAGGWDPRGIIVHHDASPEGPSDGVARYIAETAPYAPLSQLWVDYHGVWHVLAHGNCNHAGRGDGWGPIPANRGNEHAIGVETDFTTGETLREPFYRSVVAGVRALADHLGFDPVRAVCGHKEYAPGRKTDPDWNMDRFRRDVAGLTIAGTTTVEAPKPWLEDIMVAGEQQLAKIADALADNTKVRGQAAQVRRRQAEVEAARWVAEVRAQFGLDPDPASDVWWAPRLADGRKTVTDVVEALAEKAAT